LGETGLLAFNFDASFASLTQLEKNRIRRQALLDMDYRSPFRIGITVYFSIPTPASGSTWSGVSGLLRLFGREALDAIAAAEQRRMDGLIRGFIGNRGAVITFQRDAYEGLRPQDAPAYSLALAKRGELVGTCRSNARIPLYGAPPTRLLHNRQAREALQRVTSCHQDTIKRI